MTKNLKTQKKELTLCKRWKMTAFEIFDFQAPYYRDPESSAYHLIDLVRKGVSYSQFNKFAQESPFNMGEWSSYLHLSERTMLRYKKENTHFDSLQSEKILEIIILYKKGVEVFGTQNKFNYWLDTKNLVLDQTKPKNLFDSSFGIALLNEELSRIEYGILA